MLSFQELRINLLRIFLKSHFCLTIKNKEGPSQFKEFDEILIKRKIEKDKGSKYFINDKEVRARDIQTLC